MPVYRTLTYFSTRFMHEPKILYVISEFQTAENVIRMGLGGHFYGVKSAKHRFSPQLRMGMRILLFSRRKTEEKSPAVYACRAQDRSVAVCCLNHQAVLFPGRSYMPKSSIFFNKN